MKSKTLIEEQERIKQLINSLNEQENKIYTDFDKNWDYMIKDNTWYTSKKNQNKWVSLKNYPDAISKLNQRYKTTVQSTPTNNVTKPAAAPTAVTPPVVAKNEPPIASKGITGKNEFYSNVDPKYKELIDINKLSSKSNTNICSIDTTECAQFVNDFSTKLTYVGDAWTAFDTPSVGKQVFSVFRNLTDTDVKKYDDIYKGIQRGIDQTANIINFEKELIARNGQPRGLKVGDVVGIFYPPSLHHVKAFNLSGKRYHFANGDLGNTVKIKRIGHTFNTHVGIVGAIKNGVPLIFHNVGDKKTKKGQLISSPLNKLQIVWVKRP